MMRKLLILLVAVPFLFSECKDESIPREPYCELQLVTFRCYTDTVKLYQQIGDGSFKLLSKIPSELPRMGCDDRFELPLDVFEQKFKPAATYIFKQEYSGYYNSSKLIVRIDTVICPMKSGSLAYLRIGGDASTSCECFPLDD